MMDEREPIIRAEKAREDAYAPYSGYTVGAAVLTCDGRIVTGCNIENASYPAGICAERTAIFKAVSEGAASIKMLALSAGRAGEQPFNYPSPCGICRQVMVEFGREDMTLLLAKSTDDYRRYTLGELLPLSFTAKDI